MYIPRSSIFIRGKHRDATCTYLRRNSKICVKSANPHLSNVVDYDLITLNLGSAPSPSVGTYRAVHCEDETIGPIFMKEPPNRVDFSNTTGAVVECAARGSPTPDVIWVRADGTAVGDVPGLRQVLPNGNLVFPPFRAEDYRQEVHAQVYACLARNPVGTIHSRDVNVRAVVAQHYDTDVNKEYVIMGNSIILKCQVPSFVADFIDVLSWHTDENEDFYPGENYVVQQQYESEVNNEYVIRGNSAILKCSIPSFVADFVNVVSWHDEAGNAFTPTENEEGNVVNQFYEAEILTEYVIRGNAAVLKCSIPSFVADFVKVESWIDEEGTIISYSEDLVVSQYYVTEAENEYVIRGNAAIVRCKIPSFVSDFVQVEAWIMDDGLILTMNHTNIVDVVSQSYEAEADNEYVIRGNAAVMKCEVPSFVSDFVYVEMWTDSDGGTYYPGHSEAVLQTYEGRVNDEFVLRGNTAILKCIVPSFVADFVHVVAWIMDNETVLAEENPNYDSVVHQNYEPRVTDEDVLRGNSAIVKCTIPSFVADYVQVVEWVTDDESLPVFSLRDSEGNYAVNQFYESQVYDIYVIRGNAAVFKCHIPSFVSDHVHIISWHDSEGGEFLIVSQAYDVKFWEEYVLRGNAAVLKCQIPSFVAEYVSVSSWIISEDENEQEIKINDSDTLVVSQAYAVNLMEEYVLRGNAAILKCHIPSFVSEYVNVISWIISEGDEELEIKLESDENFDEGKYLVLPSGELHIRDVGPEDGYKSYQCRTKHRLTGETRLSATKGRLVITEPVGRVSPKFTTSDKSRAFDTKEDDNVTLLCPAQAYPAPAFRLKRIPFPYSGKNFNETEISRVSLSQNPSVRRRLRFLWNLKALHLRKSPGKRSFFCVRRKLIRPPCSKPTNKIAPRKDSTKHFEGWEVLFVSRLEVAYLTCQIAAYPAPVFRWYKFIDGTTRKQPVVLNDRVKQVSGTLIIKEAKVEDSGKYLCVVNNSVGGESVETVLTVTAPLKATVEPATQTVDFGRPAVFTCRYEGNPIKTVTWLKDGKDMNHHDAILRIESVKKEDKGMYQCFIRNDQESAGASAELKLGGRFEPPQIRHNFGEQTLRSGPPLRLRCVASGNPTPDIAWLLDGEKLSSGDRLQIGQFVTADGNVESNLNISSVHTNDGGLYSCIASSKVGSASHAARVNVYGLPYVRPMKKRPVVAGDTLIAHCPVAGYPIESIVWERDNRVLPINRKQKVYPNGTLVIENVERMSDQATYTCVAKNSQSYTAKGTLELQVMVPPQILPFEFGDEPANAGELASVTCAVNKGDQPLDISWTLNGHALRRNNDLGVTITNINKKTSILNIDSVNAIHRGLYYCVAKNAAGTANHSAVLEVNVPPQITPFEFGEEILNEGETASVSCVMNKGDLPVTFQWLFNGEEIKPHNSLNIVLTTISKKTSIMNIESVNYAHRGSYTCRLKNAAGETNHTTLLSVNVLPQIHPFTFGDEPANAGDMVGVQCMVTKGDTPVAIKWRLNGKDVKEIPGITVTMIGHKSSTLSIDSVSLVTPFDFGEEILNAGDTVSLTCTVGKGDLPLNIHWQLNNEVLNSGNGILINRNGKRISILSIENVQHEHIGNYTCISENEAGRSSHSALLKVNVAPQIMPFDFGTEPVNDQEMLVVTCTASKGDSPFIIQWYFDGKILRSGENGVVLASSKRTSQLTIESVSHRNQGNYTCLVKNQAGSVNHTAELYVNGISNQLLSLNSFFFFLHPAVPPQIKPFDFGEEPINAQEMVLITCTVNKGDQPLTIDWYFNKNKVKSGSTGINLMNTKRSSQLSIDSVSHQNQGNYTCVVKNEAGSVNYTAQLFVNVAPIITPFEFDESVFYGEGVQVMCHVPKGDKPLTFNWSFNGGDVSSLPGLNIMNVGDMGSVLIIPAVTAAHSGNYTCTAANVVARASHLATLNVKVAPIISPFEFDEAVFYGESIQVMCHIPKGDMPLTLKWLFRDRPLESSSAVTVTKVGHRSSILAIPSVTEKNSGNYTCTASNTVASTNHTAILNVQVPPHIVPFDAEEPVFAGESVQLNCHINKGDAPIAITWSFHGKDLSSHQGITTMKIGQRTSLLTIASATASHSGEYACHASNHAGLAVHSTLVNVHAMPHIVPFEADESVFAGESVQLTCHVSKGDLPLDIKWHFHGLDNSSSHLGIMTTKMTSRTSFLSIAAAGAGHSGRYTHFSVLPHIRPYELDEAVFAGETAHIDCYVSKGDLPLNITWSFQGKPVTDKMGIKTTNPSARVSILDIPSALGSHSGNYTCIATNRAGSANHTAVLNVIGTTL
ncbi:Down syndrome cell adhesion molecule-like protein CG42256 [Papilio xuthus]|uniref:Down syndrome cell adhesion molecule-like protein CG42256 n=1 Tax=Papilio xuthus TaxID=66420 RepID=A0A194PHD9_PAPXU|nr:Down syndrome cell adhesion molecule-like protein CG42256 [Papilio xuthus]